MLPPSRKSVWRTSTVVFLALVAYTVAVYASAPIITRFLPASWLIATQVGLAVIPGVLWLMFFYLQDRREPEPKHYVVGVFLLGAVLARLIALPLLQDVFRISEWIYASGWVLIAGAILTVGAVQEFLKFIAVRYTVYGSSEFNEPLDGIMYSTAAGLGFATMLNINYILVNDGVDLQVGIIRIAVTALAHASFAGVLGYFMGRAKFREGSDVLPLLGGLAAAALLNGTFFFTDVKLSSFGLDYNPWNGLALAFALATTVTALLFLLIRRATVTTGDAPKPELRRYVREDLVLTTAVVVVLFAGLLLRHYVVYGTRYFASPQRDVQIDLPARWLANQPGAALIAVTNPVSASAYPTRLEVSREVLPPEVTEFGLVAVAAGRALEQARELQFYRQIATRPIMVSGKPGLESEYVHVADPGNNSFATVTLPIVVRAHEVFVQNGNQLVVVRFTTDDRSYEREVEYLKRALTSLKLN